MPAVVRLDRQSAAMVPTLRERVCRTWTGMFPLLKTEVQTELHHSLVQAVPAYPLGAGDRGVVAETANAAVAVEQHAGHIGRGITEMRRVGRVEHMKTELKSHFLGDAKISEDGSILIGGAGTPHGVEAGCSKGGSRHGRKGQRVEPRLSWPGPPVIFHLRLDLVRALRVAWRIQRST